MKMPPQHYGYHHATPQQYRPRIGFALEHRRKPTKAESVLWKALKGKRLAGYKFRRQHVIGNYIVDFVCLKRKLIVEVDGDIHLAPSQQRYDEDRTEFLEANGFRVIRFWNDAVLERLDAVLDTILETLNAG
ncbi:endonuclease domain-containing protein [Flaviaesturariibacter amylovorans]|uniref:endonuclease domain-containing protein n=1 Tax=Flaviaesturariibacter amylovorans TaxID=1084520 RepID=UPI0031EE1C20